LTFLGDGVLGALVAHHAFTAFPWGDEGVLSDARIGVTSNKMLALYSFQLGLPSLLLVGERNGSGIVFRDCPKEITRLVVGAMEGLMAALYLDQGLGACRKLLARLLFPCAADLPLRRAWLAAACRPAPTPDATPAAPATSEHDARLLAFQEQTGMRFRSFGLLRQALTHPSFFHTVETPAIGTGWAPSARVCPGAASAAQLRGGVDPRLHNQRLEWLGDALLNLAAIDYVLHHYPEDHEHPVQLLRTALVNNPTICDAAAKCGMQHAARFSHDQLGESGRARDKMLADCFEATIGALYLDRQPLGLAAVKAFTSAVLFPITQATVAERRWMDPKARLQYALNVFSTTAGVQMTKRFELLEEHGPAHERMYVVGCFVNEVLVATARGLSITDAQMGAALRAQEELHLTIDD